MLLSLCCSAEQNDLRRQTRQATFSQRIWPDAEAGNLDNPVIDLFAYDEYPDEESLSPGALTRTSLFDSVSQYQEKSANTFGTRESVLMQKDCHCHPCKLKPAYWG